MVRVAIIGAGHWGPNLINNFHLNPRSEVAWVVDRDERRLEIVAERFPGVSTTSDFERAVSDRTVDAVVIATPTQSHHALAKRALEAGKHALVEKPLTASTKTSVELRDLADSVGRVLMVGHVFVYNAAARHVKHCVDTGELGRLYYISMVRTNLGPIRVDVDASWDLAAHDVSLANYWLDDRPVSVSAVGGAWINPGIADAVFATLHYRPGVGREDVSLDDASRREVSGREAQGEGILVNLHASWLNPRKARDITVVGDRRMLTFDDTNLEEPVRIYDKQVMDERSQPGFVDSFTSFRMSVHEGEVSMPEIERSEPLRNECEHFLDCIVEGRAPLSGGPEGLAVVRVLDALSESLREGGRSVAIDWGALER